MKLQTSILPRKDGTVRLLGLDGVNYTFAPDANGDMVCDVTHEPTIVHALEKRSEYFWPADEADHDEANRLIAEANSSQVVADDDQDDDSDDDGPDGDTIIAPGSDGGLPVEANTPPQTIPGKGKRVKAAAKTAANK
jgi:hypothetical protein